MTGQRQTDGAAYRDEPLGTRDRSAFSCGVEPLDSYFRQQVGQDQRRRLAAPYVLIEAASDEIVGFYTLSAFSVLASEMPPDATRRLPRYDAYPALLIGRLAVDSRWRRRGLGRMLLGNALRRCLVLSGQLGAVAVVVDAVDAKDEAARAFYEHEGFLRLADHEWRLYVPMKSVADAVG